jgi:hypothetical protein
MSALGYNPLRWDCDKNGCFNVKRRPKIETFAECFPRKCNFGDVDGIVEIEGRGLVLEWKGEPMALPVGQSIMWKRLTKDRTITLLCVAGDPQTMDVTHRAMICSGTWRDWKPSSLSDLKASIREWVRWAEAHSLVRP